MKIIATGKYNADGMTIPVNVHKIRNEFGRIRYTITPVHGTGQVKREGVQLDAEFKTLLDNVL